MMKANTIRQLITWQVVFLLTTWLLSASPAFAHPLGEVVQKTYVWLGQAQILIDYETTIGPSISQSLEPDSDRDGRVTLDEEQALLKRIAQTVLKNLEIHIDRIQIEPQYFGGVLQLFKDGARINGIEARMQFSLEPEEAAKGMRELTFSDHNFLEGELSSLNYFVPVVQKVEQTEVWDQGRTLYLQYRNPPPAGSAREVESIHATTDSDQANPPNKPSVCYPKLAGFGGAISLALGLFLLIPSVQARLRNDTTRLTWFMATLLILGGLAAIFGALGKYAIELL